MGGACGVRGVWRGAPLRLRQLVLSDGDGLRPAPGGGGALELRLDRVDLHRALRIRRVEVTHGVLGRLLGRYLLLVPHALLLLLDARAVRVAQVLAHELLAARDRQLRVIVARARRLLLTQRSLVVEVKLPRRLGALVGLPEVGDGDGLLALRPEALLIQWGSVSGYGVALGPG